LTRLWPLLGCLLLAGLCASVPAADPPPTVPSQQGTYLGILFVPSPSGEGVKVYHVLPDSPAARAELRRDDVLLRYDQETIRDCEHLVQLIRKDMPNRTVRLAVLRDGKELSVPVTLALGPMLRYADGTRTEPTTGPAKPHGPAPVSVSAEPLGQGKMRVTVEYYDEGVGRWRTLTGDLDAVENDCRKLPAREQHLIGVALQRLRTLNGEPMSSKRPPPQR
jgi:hypothetical protein